MFATIEEAEKAAAMLRRFGGQDSWMIHPHTQAHALGIGHGETICDWEGLADFLLERHDDPPEDGRRKELRVQAVKEYLSTARDILRAQTSDKSMAIHALVYAVETILEALP